MRFKLLMTQLPDLRGLSHDEKDALILALWSQVQALTERVLGLEEVARFLATAFRFR